MVSGAGGPSPSVAAAIVAFQPGSDLSTVIDSVVPQVAKVFLIDNGGLAPRAPDPAVMIIRNPHNLGVAAALNQALAPARAAGCDWLLALDQDVRPAPDMVDRLIETVHDHATPQRLAIVASNLGDAELGIRARFLRRRAGPFFQRAECRGERLDSVAIAVSAGSLYRLDVLAQLGGFREDFFIDYVDTEYCLRVLAAGYRIAVACRARLDHRLGDRRRVRLGPATFFPTHHSPQRWYYIARNRVPMIRLYAGRFPFWLTYDLIAGGYGLLRMLVLEGGRRRKLAALILGTRDGLRRRMGPAPAYPILEQAV